MVKKSPKRSLIRKVPLFLFLLGIFALSISRLGFSKEAQTQKMAPFKKLDSEYTISLGNPKAPIQIVEYFSFSCPKCIDFMLHEFPVIKQKYIDQGKMHWTFHPDPADILTLQAMVCLSKMNSQEKWEFLKHTALETTKSSPKAIGRKMEKLMEISDRSVAGLTDLSFLETTSAFESAYEYLKQKGVPSELPTIEVNGTIYFDEFPSLSLIRKIEKDMMQSKVKESLVMKNLNGCDC